ncbi:RsiV family protein [Helicobacter didelphidarum]|nr:RsiV family protein [Helicobacter didelphidarum]
MLRISMCFVRFHIFILLFSSHSLKECIIAIAIWHSLSLHSLKQRCNAKCLSAIGTQKYLNRTSDFTKKKQVKVFYDSLRWGICGALRADEDNTIAQKDKKGEKMKRLFLGVCMALLFNACGDRDNQSDSSINQATQNTKDEAQIKENTESAKPRTQTNSQDTKEASEQSKMIESQANSQHNRESHLSDSNPATRDSQAQNLQDSKDIESQALQSSSQAPILKDSQATSKADSHAIAHIDSKVASMSALVGEHTKATRYEQVEGMDMHEKRYDDKITYGDIERTRLDGSYNESEENEEEYYSKENIAARNKVIAKTQVKEKGYVSSFFQLDGFIEGESKTGEKTINEVRVWAYYELINGTKVVRLELPFGLTPLSQIDKESKSRSTLTKEEQKHKLDSISELEVHFFGLDTCRGFEAQGIWQSNELINTQDSRYVEEGVEQDIQESPTFQNLTSSLNGKRFYFCESNTPFSHIYFAHLDLQEKRLPNNLPQNATDATHSNESDVKDNRESYPTEFIHRFSVPFVDYRKIFDDLALSHDKMRAEMEYDSMLSLEEAEKFNAFLLPLSYNGDMSIDSIFYTQTDFIKGICHESVCGGKSIDVLPNAEIYAARNEIDFSSQFIDEMNIGYIDSQIIAFDRFLYTFMGGAHGVPFYTSRFYDIAGQRDVELSLSDVFIEPKELLGLLEARLKDKEVDTSMLFKPNEPLNVLPSSFRISPKGITFIYNVYEIAPYVMGAIELEFGFVELREFAKKDSVLSHLFE